MGILTPHWLQHLQASFKVTGTEAGHDRGEAAHPHSSKDKPTLSRCLLELRSSEGPGVRVGWGSGMELDSFQEMEEKKEGRRRERRGGLYWSRSKIQGGKT